MKLLSKFQRILMVLQLWNKVIKFTENFETRRRIMKIISKHTSQLVQDPYGNYVLQESLDNWYDTNPELVDDNDNWFFAGLFKNIVGKIERLAIQKFSSNVIEKCLERSNDYYRSKFIKEIIEGESISIMKNSYGNYVFQKSLALAKGIDKFKIIDVIFKNFPTIQDQKIKMKWIKLLKKNIKQEDVLEADAEQDSLNLEIDQTINYSHKFKLINDELSRYDSNQSKKDKLKQSNKKKGGSGYEQNMQESYSAGIYNPHMQSYQGSKMSYGGADPSMKMMSPMYPPGAPMMMKGKQFESVKSQYQPPIINQPYIPPPPIGYMPQYQYHPMSAGVPMMAPPMNDMNNMEYGEGYYGIPPNMMGQDNMNYGYPGSRDNQQ